MARNNDRDRSTRRAPRENTRRTKKKICIFCKDHADGVDYKDVNLLRKFMSDRGKIRARRVSGNCAQHQRDVAVAIKTARELALLPYTQRTTSERPSGRGPGRGPGGGRSAGPRDSDGGGHAPAAVAVAVEEDEDLEVSDEFEAEAGGDDAGVDDGDGE
jgi:small subunit ribosomal protein S18